MSIPVTFLLNTIDIESWYDSMPRSVKAEAIAMAQSSQHQSKKITRIDQYYASSRCIVCREVADQGMFLLWHAPEDVTNSIFT